MFLLAVEKIVAVIHVDDVLCSCRCHVDVVHECIAFKEESVVTVFPTWTSNNGW